MQKKHAEPVSVETAINSAVLLNHAEQPLEYDECTHTSSIYATSTEVESVSLPNYDLIEALGSGGMGSVYKARHKAVSRTMAVKLLHKGLADDPVNIKRFHQEAKAASLLTHANLVSVYESGITNDGRPYLVMDHLDGKSLDKVLENEGFLDLETFFHIFIQVCEALSHAHSKKIIHRDLKPSNIMIVPTEHDSKFVKLVDFGIARVLQKETPDKTQLTQTGAVIGSPTYMSPEQCLGKTIDERSDIYSLGVVMFEALTGRPPFAGDNPIQVIVKHINDEPRMVSKVRPDFSLGQLDDLIQTALEKKPEHRFQSVDELTNELKRIARAPALAVKSRRNARRRSDPNEPGQRKLPALGLGLALAATIAVIGAMVLVSKQQPIIVAPAIPHVSAEAPPPDDPKPAVKTKYYPGSVAAFLAEADEAKARKDWDGYIKAFESAEKSVTRGKHNLRQLCDLRIRAGDCLVEAVQPPWDSNDPVLQAADRETSHAALEFYKRAMLLCQRLNDPWTEIKIIDKLGADMNLQENFETLLLRKVHLAKDLSINDAFNAYDILGSLYEQGGKTAKAEKVYRDAVALVEKADTWTLPGPATKLANIYRVQGKFTDEEHYRKIDAERTEVGLLNNSYDMEMVKGRYADWAACLRKFGRNSDANRVWSHYLSLAKKGAH